MKQLIIMFMFAIILINQQFLVEFFFIYQNYVMFLNLNINQLKSKNNNCFHYDY
jgi:hypothetical protein